MTSTTKKGNTMDKLEQDLIVCTVLIQMLENQKHVWSNKLSLAKDIRHDGDQDRICMILDSIDLEIERQKQQITYIANFAIRPLP